MALVPNDVSTGCHVLISLQRDSLNCDALAIDFPGGSEKRGVGFNAVLVLFQPANLDGDASAIDPFRSGGQDEILTTVVPANSRS